MSEIGPAAQTPTSPRSQSSEALDLVAATLADLRRSLRGNRSKVGASKRSRPRDYSSPVNSESGLTERDPILLGTGLTDLVEDRGWSGHTAVAGVIGRWAELVGADLSAHVVPESFDEAAGLLSLKADSTTWATQTRMLTAVIQARLDSEIGIGIVRQIDVAGPAARARMPGRFSVPGRGPRDTYG